MKGDEDMNKRRIFSLLLASILLLEVSGCMPFSPKLTDVALKMMKEKYGVEFTIVERWGGTLSSKSYGYLVTCDSFPDDKINIEVTRMDDGTIRCRDNYLSYFYYEQTKEKLNEIIGTVFQEWKLRYKIQPYLISELISSNASFDEFIKVTSIFISINVCVVDNNTDNKQQNIDTLINLFINNNIFLSCGVFYTNLSNFINIDFNNYQSYMVIDNRYNAICSFALKENGDFLYFDWS